MPQSPFGIRSDERTAFFIDGPNTYSACKALNANIDYRKLLSHFNANTRFLRAYYYTAVADTDEDFSPIRPLLDFLDYNGYDVMKKQMHRAYGNEGAVRQRGGHLDVEMTVDMMRVSRHVDHIVLFSGDGDMRYLVEALQQDGKRVSAVSTLKGSSPFIHDDLRRQVDQFIELENVLSVIRQEQPVVPAFLTKPAAAPAKA